MKKLMLVCAMAMVLSRAFCSTEEIDGITWTYSIVDGKAYLGNDKGSLYGLPGISDKTSGDVVVPQKVGGYSVIGLREGMFYGCFLITNVQVPIGVESIGTRAFYKCLSLENISLPDGLLSIGYGAFDHCSSLRSITIPSTVTNLDVTAFENCDSLTNIVCLGKISLRESSYGGYSYNWWGCTNLLSAIVRDVDYATFYGCDKLSQVTFLEGAKIIRNDAFKGCSSLAKICFPEGLVFIGQSAFSGCRSLIEVSIPNSVTSIGSGAFSACSLVARVEIKNSNTTVDISSFAGCNSVVDITIPQDVCNKKVSDFFDTYQMITNINIAEGVSKIEANCFEGCKSIVQLSIPASVTRIADNAFLDCSSLEEIIFEGDAPTFGADVFAGVPRRMKIRVKEGSVGWNGTASSELPEYWNGFTISYLSDSDDDTPDSSGGTNQNPPSGGEAVANDPRYDMTSSVGDRAIANVEIDGDTAIDSFVLKDGKVFDAVVRIVNLSASEAKITLPADYIYEKFKGTNPLLVPAASTNLLTITRTKGDTFLLSREELVLEEQK